MKFSIPAANGSSYEAYAYTGGKAFDANKPTVVFIHGVLHDHSVWILQSRYLAHHGFNVLAVDLPGHCRSGGDALTAWKPRQHLLNNYWMQLVLKKLR